MENTKEINKNLIKAFSSSSRTMQGTACWYTINRNNDILRDAMTVRKDNKGEVITAPFICEMILSKPNDIDQKIYYELIDKIYSNELFEKQVSKDFTNKSYINFLYLSLLYNDASLTEEQKKHAVNIASHKAGAKLFDRKVDKENEKEYHYYLTHGNDDIFGIGDFDIRYAIVHNKNWTPEEIKELLSLFWVSDYDYSNAVDSWEHIIVQLFDRYNEYRNVSHYDYDSIATMDDEDIQVSIKDKAVIDRIKSEKDFISLMHSLRPTRKDQKKEEQIKKGF